MTDFYAGDGNSFATRDLTTKVQQILDLIPQCTEDAACEALIACEEEVQNAVVFLLDKIDNGKMAAANRASSVEEGADGDWEGSAKERKEQRKKERKAAEAAQAAAEAEAQQRHREEVEKRRAAAEGDVPTTASGSPDSKDGAQAASSGKADGWGDTAAEETATKQRKPELSAEERAAQQAKEEEEEAERKRREEEAKEPPIVIQEPPEIDDAEPVEEVPELSFFKEEAKKGRPPTKAEKELLKLKKKISDIEKIEAKVAKKEKVDPLQLPKIDKKAGLLEEAAAVSATAAKELEKEAEQLQFEHKKAESKRVKAAKRDIERRKKDRLQEIERLIQAEKDRRKAEKQRIEEERLQKIEEEKIRQEEAEKELERQRVREEEERKAQVEAARRREEEQQRARQQLAEEARAKKEREEADAQARMHRYNYAPSGNRGSSGVSPDKAQANDGGNEWGVSASADVLQQQAEARGGEPNGDLSGSGKQTSPPGTGFNGGMSAAHATGSEDNWR